MPRVTASRDRIREKVVELAPIAVRPRIAAELVGCSESTIRKLIKQGEIKTIVVGCDMRVLLKSLHAYINQ